MGQRERILDYLTNVGPLVRIHSWEKLGILEAPARISELRARGHNIKTEMIPVTNRFGETVKVARWSLEKGQGELFG